MQSKSLSGLAALFALLASLALASCHGSDARDAARRPRASPPPIAVRPCPPGGTPCRIMPLGDSITFGIGSSDPPAGYRAPLFHLARAAGTPVTFVGSRASGPPTVDGVPFPAGNEGYPGYTIDASERGGLLPLVADALRAYAPHIVLLMVGTNDLATNNDLPRAPDRLAALIDRITAAAPDALLVVACVLPTRIDVLDARVRAYNAAIPDVVRARARAGRRVAWVDPFEAFVANPRYRTEWLMDAVHPNDAGYVQMAEVWFRALAPLLR
jgi:lysophospholipase L1-like esterase